MKFFPCFLLLSLFIIYPLHAQIGGNALNFDGSNDSVSIPSSAQLNFGTSTNFTLEAWVKLYSSQTNYTGIIAKADNSSSTFYQLVIVENKIAAEVSNGGAFAGTGQGFWGTTNLFDSSWHHVAMVVTRSSQNVKLYVDGVVEADTIHSAVVSDLNNTGNMLLGCDRTYSQHFKGSIDEVRVWNVARSSADINTYKSVEIDPLTSGLMAYYRLNQGTAGGDNSAITYATDATSYANNGTLNNFMLNGATSNWILANNSALPVELTSFAALLTSDLVELIWQTASEVNNYGFEVERISIGEQSSAISRWELVGFVKGSGNSNSIKNYAFTDRTVKSNKVLYRLKQIDNDGKYIYSNTVQVNINTLLHVYSLQQNYPNPFNPSTTIEFTIKEKSRVKLNIYNALGQYLTTILDKDLLHGKHKVVFDGSSYASGIYFYQITTENYRNVKKFILLR